MKRKKKKGKEESKERSKIFFYEIQNKNMQNIND